MLTSDTTIPVTVDKSHLITIGEKLYTESIELIRELVNNAYDADASEVHVILTEERIEVSDDGTGMNLAGLKQYFNIGSAEKKNHPRSKKLGRDRIGQFGIGKFASLAACGSFTISTQQGDFSATVTFDKEAWESKADSWELPLTIHPPDPAREDGTTVLLAKLSKRFNPDEVERRLIESVPIKAEDFKVFVNDKVIQPRLYAGQRIPFLEGTPFGPIHGEIVLLPASSVSMTEPLGIECKVKQVTIKRELFGMEKWGRDIARIRGEVHADFLPVTSDRSGFVVDSEECRVFSEAMLRVMQETRKVLIDQAGQRETRGVRKAMREALHRVQSALSRYPDLAPPGMIPLGVKGEGVGGAGFATDQQKGKAESIENAASGEGKKSAVPKPRVKKPKAVALTPNAIIQRMKLGHTGISCCLDQFGVEGPECFTEGQIIYVNRDHPLFKRQLKNKAAHTMHLARLLTQEIAMMKDPKETRKAFANQSSLLREAFAEESS